MPRARQISLLLIVVSASAPALWARSSLPPSQASAATPAPDLTIHRAIIEEANAARAGGDYATARAMVAEVVTFLLARPEAEQDAAWLELLDYAGSAAHDAQDLHSANKAWQRVLAVRLRTLPDDHPDLQKARESLAGTLYAVGELHAAHALCEKVLEVRMRTLPEDHPDLQVARQNLATTIKKLGDLPAARALEERVLAVCSRTLPADHPALQVARSNLAVTLKALGDLQGARSLLEQVLEVRLRTLPNEHPDVQLARGNLAATILSLGDLQGARALEEQVLEIRARTLPDDHPDLQSARQNLAATIKALGDLLAARALEEKVLEVRSRTLPDEHPDLQLSRENLGTTIYALDDLDGARSLFEKVLEVRSRTLPDDHPDLQSVRHNLAMTLKALGDLDGASALLEQVLELRSRTLPDDHPNVQQLRENLSATILIRAALAPSESEEKRERGDPGTDRKRVASLIRSFCQAHTRAARAIVLSTTSREAEERCARLARELGVVFSVSRGSGVQAPLQELEPDAFAFAETTRGAALASAAASRRAAESPQYEPLRQHLRQASADFAAKAQEGATPTELESARRARESAERELVELAKDLSGHAPVDGTIDVPSVAAVLTDREAAVGFRRVTKWRFEVTGRSDPNERPVVRQSAEESVCAFVVRAHDPSNPGNALLTLIDLGPIEPIERAVNDWRDGLGLAAGRGTPAVSQPAVASLSTRGDAIRRLVFDPLESALGDTNHVVLALDDLLHLVPFDALPADLEGRVLLGERVRFEIRSTLWELLHPPAPVQSPLGLLGIGDVRYAGVEEDVHDGNAPAVAGSALSRAVDAQSPRILQAGAWSGGFTPLPATRAEVEGVERYFTDTFGPKSERQVLAGAEATKLKLLELAPRARWLHIATHGWFAPESVRSWNDPRPLDEHTGLGMRLGGEEQIKGMSPMLLCGLALVGANQPEDALGHVPGLMTAEELSTLDLSNCELAVLSACDTNVGERRAGQGVASLQKALQMAGARSVITSLWKVPDEATKELMLDFYRRLWVEKKPKWQALWEAKTMLRNAKDERGEPKYSTRDWAAWVLTGEPD